MLEEIGIRKHNKKQETKYYKNNKIREEIKVKALTFSVTKRGKKNTIMRRNVLRGINYENKQQYKNSKNIVDTPERL